MNNPNKPVESLVLCTTLRCPPLDSIGTAMLGFECATLNPNTCCRFPRGLALGVVQSEGPRSIPAGDMWLFLATNCWARYLLTSSKCS